MNILITGAFGQLGTSLMVMSKNKKHKYHYADIRTDTPDIDYLDITNEKEVNEYVTEYNIDVIVNCAAYTNVEAAEDKEDVAYEINARAAKVLADAIAKRNGWLIHISTDYVFGTEPYNTPCTETMQGTPLGAYGRTKKAGEELIQHSGCKYIIIRTSWLYSEYGNNFVKTIINKINNSKDELIRVVDDQVGTPTYAKDLAQAILHIINNSIDGNDKNKEYVEPHITYNYSNEGVCSWYDFAYEIFKQYKPFSTMLVVPCKSYEYPSKVKRPSYSVLDKTMIKLSEDITIPHWRESLKECIKSIQDKEITNISSPYFINDTKLNVETVNTTANTISVSGDVHSLWFQYNPFMD